MLDYIERRNLMEELQRQRTDISDHLETLRMLVVEFELCSVLELGVRGGNSTLALLAGIDEIGGSVLSVDLDPCERARERIAKHGLLGYWIFFQSDALAFRIETCPYYRLIFVDLDHGYDETMAVLETYAPLVQTGGFFVFHDTVSYPELELALGEFIATHDDWRFYHWLNCSGLTICRRGKC